MVVTFPTGTLNTPNKLGGTPLFPSAPNIPVAPAKPPVTPKVVIPTGSATDAAKVAADAKTAADKAAADKVAADKVTSDKTAADKAAADAKAKTDADYAAAHPTTPIPGTQEEIDAVEKQRLADLAQGVADAQTANKKQEDIMNGTIPLDAGQTAQIQGLMSQFQHMIDTQSLINTGATGTANIRGFQSGAGENPLFHLNVIGSIIKAGTSKILDLQVQAASAVAQLTQAFRSDNAKVVKDSYDRLKTAQDALDKGLQDHVTKVQAALKAASDAKIAADKVQYDEVTKPIQQMAQDASKFGAPQKVVDAINGATSVADAIKASVGYTNDPTSPAGQYNSYVKQATAAGQTPISPAAFLAQQKYSEAYATSKGSEAGKLAADNAAGTNATAVSGLPADQVAALKANGFSSFSATTQNLAQQLVEGRMAPAEASKRSTGASSYSDILSAADKYSMATTGKHFDIAKADRNYKFASNAQTQNTLNFLGSLVGSDNGSGLAGGNLDQLVSLSQSLNTGKGTIAGTGGVPLSGRTSFPALNNAQQWTQLQVGNPQVAAYYSTLLEVSDQVAKILQGGGSGGGTSDAKLAQAAALFQKGFTPDQVAAVATQLKELLGSRAAAMVRDNPYLSDYATQFGVKTVNGVTTTNQKIMQNETVATGKIANFYNASPDNAKIVDQIHSQFPDMSAQEIIQQLSL